eukprot:gb/GEZJ01004372.1/.p4 GENE.gb/GEZJ01004372.1/~~gb/GEZJ01004372.1/.p4  ORF type:complete len:123 (-),score=21.48 gb/GEZJ01004372.1/:632-1000(-)
MAFVSVVPHVLRARAREARRCERLRPRAALRPLSDRVLVRPDVLDAQSASGLFLAPSEQQKSTTGEVVAVGAGRYSTEGVLEPMPFTPGDRVLWKDDFGAEPIEFDGEQLVAFRAFSLVAKV